MEVRQGVQDLAPVQLTPRALEAVKRELKKIGAGKHLRISVNGGGCSGYQYDLDFSDVIGPGDMVTDVDGLRVVVDERSSLYLQGTTIDFIEQFGGGGFKFLNPNARQSCGCGTSFQA